MTAQQKYQKAMRLVFQAIKSTRAAQREMGHIYAQMSRLVTAILTDGDDANDSLVFDADFVQGQVDALLAHATTYYEAYYKDR